MVMIATFIALLFSIVSVPKIVQTISEPKPVTILFLGDMMFDRSVRVKANSIGYENIFGPSTTTIAQYDLTIANLEGPITSYKSKLVTDSGKAISGFQFTFDPLVAFAIKKAGIDIVSLANNHTLNFAQDGLNQTRKILTENNLTYFGSPSNTPAYTATSTCINNICIGMIGWNEFGFVNDELIIDKIKEMRSHVDYLVIYPHWGIEYQITPSKKQTDLAHKWIDAGADVIIGAHPHVVETVEVYKNKYIFYSLGNFIFDQYFSFNTTHGIGVGATIYKDKVEYKIIPFSSVGSKVSIPSENNIKKLFDILRKNSGSIIAEMIR